MSYQQLLGSSHSIVRWCRIIAVFNDTYVVVKDTAEGEWRVFWARKILQIQNKKRFSAIRPWCTTELISCMETEDKTDALKSTSNTAHISDDGNASKAPAQQHVEVRLQKVEQNLDKVLKSLEVLTRAVGDLKNTTALEALELEVATSPAATRRNI